MLSAGRSAPVQKSPSVDSCISHLQINCSVAIETAQEPPVIQPQCRCHEWAAHPGHCGFSSPVWLSLGHPFPPWQHPCTHLAPPGSVQHCSHRQHTHTKAVFTLREHLLIHSYAHFDNQCRSFQHRGNIINPRYPKYFWLLLHNSHGTWPRWLSRILIYFLMWNSSPEISYHLTNDSELIYWGNGDL